MVQWPPFGPTMKIFYRRLYIKSAFFAVFQQISLKNGRICGFHQKQKVFQLQGGFAPLTPDQELCPWTPLGAPPPDTLIGSRSARSPWLPSLPNPKYATEVKQKVSVFWHTLVNFPTEERQLRL